MTERELFWVVCILVVIVCSIMAMGLRYGGDDDRF